MRIDLEKSFNFRSNEWATLRAWLVQTRETKVDLLIGSKSHEASLELQGAIKQIDMLLQIEKAALNAALNRN